MFHFEVRRVINMSFFTNAAKTSNIIVQERKENVIEIHDRGCKISGRICSHALERKSTS